jgi:3-hydroxyisobutyrate dehydrogenase
MMTTAQSADESTAESTASASMTANSAGATSGSVERPPLMTATVIGIGAMGMPMAQHLRNQGFEVAAVDPNPAARDRAEGAGMTAFADIAAAPATNVVLVLVATGQQLVDCVGLAIAQRQVAGSTWIISSTVGPRAAKRAATMLADAGAQAIDAPVTGGVPGAENATLRFLAAGAPELIEAHSQVFAAMGTLSLVGDHVGDGQATKIVNQLCSSVHLAAAAEAIALAQHLGLDPVRTAKVIAGGSGSSWFLDERGPRMADLATIPRVLTRLAILAKDNELVEIEADASGAHVPLLKAAKTQYTRARELGLLEADDSQIIRTYLD